MTIFVSIISYYNNDLNYTIEDLCKKAKYPELLTIAIYIQDTEEVCSEIIDKYSANSHFIVNCVKNANTTYSNMLKYNKSLLTNEQYYLQINTNIRFTLHWDIIAIQMLGQCFKHESVNNYKALLTSSGVPSYIFEKDIELVNAAIPHVLDFDYIHNNTVHIKSTPIECYNVRQIPIKTHLLCNDFLFVKSNWINIYYHQELTFPDENLVTSIIAFTSGWSLFNAYDILFYKDVSSTLYNDELSNYDTYTIITESYNSIKAVRSIDDYKYLSGYDYKNNVFIEQHTDFVTNEELWKNLYKFQSTSQEKPTLSNTEQPTLSNTEQKKLSIEKSKEEAGLKKKKKAEELLAYQQKILEEKKADIFQYLYQGTSNMIIVSLQPTKVSIKNHIYFAKRNLTSIVYCCQENIDDSEIIQRFTKKFSIIIIVNANCFFANYLSSLQTLFNSFKLRLNEYSYKCNTNNLCIFGKKTNDIKYIDLCTSITKFKFKVHGFIYIESESELNLVKVFNDKHIKKDYTHLCYELFNEDRKEHNKQ